MTSLLFLVGSKLEHKYLEREGPWRCLNSPLSSTSLTDTPLLAFASCSPHSTPSKPCRSKALLPSLHWRLRCWLFLWILSTHLNVRRGRFTRSSDFLSASLLLTLGGGKSWTGPTTCTKTDYVCFEFNDCRCTRGSDTISSLTRACVQTTASAFTNPRLRPGALANHRRTTNRISLPPRLRHHDIYPSLHAHAHVCSIAK